MEDVITISSDSDDDAFVVNKHRRLHTTSYSEQGVTSKVQAQNNSQRKVAIVKPLIVNPGTPTVRRSQPGMCSVISHGNTGSSQTNVPQQVKRLTQQVLCIVPGTCTVKLKMSSQVLPPDRQSGMNTGPLSIGVSPNEKSALQQNVCSVPETRAVRSPVMPENMNLTINSNQVIASSCLQSQGKMSLQQNESNLAQSSIKKPSHIKPWSEEAVKSFTILDRILSKKSLTNVLHYQDETVCRSNPASESRAAVALRNYKQKQMNGKISTSSNNEQPHLLKIMSQQPVSVSASSKVASQTSHQVLLSPCIQSSLSTISRNVQNSPSKIVSAKPAPLETLKRIISSDSYSLDSMSQQDTITPIKLHRTTSASKKPSPVAVNLLGNVVVCLERLNSVNIVNATKNVESSHTLMLEQEVASESLIYDAAKATSYVDDDKQNFVKYHTTSMTPEKCDRFCDDYVDATKDLSAKVNASLTKEYKKDKPTFPLKSVVCPSKQTFGHRRNFLEVGISTNTLSAVFFHEVYAAVSSSSILIFQSALDSGTFSYAQDAVISGYLDAGGALSVIAVDTISEFTSSTRKPSRKLLEKLLLLLRDATSEIVIQHLWCVLLRLSQMHSIQWDLPYWQYLVSSVEEILDVTDSTLLLARSLIIQFVVHLIEGNMPKYPSATNGDVLSASLLQRILGMDITFSNVKRVIEWIGQSVMNKMLWKASYVLCLRKLLNMFLVVKKASLRIDLEYESHRIAEEFCIVYFKLNTLEQRQQFIEFLQPTLVRIFFICLLLDGYGDSSVIFQQHEACSYSISKLSLKKILNYYFCFGLLDHPNTSQAKLSVTDSCEELVFILQNLLSSYVNFVEECQRNAISDVEQQQLRSELCHLSHDVRTAVLHLKRTLVVNHPQVAGNGRINFFLKVMLCVNEAGMDGDGT